MPRRAPARSGREALRMVMADPSLACEYSRDGTGPRRNNSRSRRAAAEQAGALVTGIREPDELPPPSRLPPASARPEPTTRPSSRRSAIASSAPSRAIRTSSARGGADRAARAHRRLPPPAEAASSDRPPRRHRPVRRRSSGPRTPDCPLCCTRRLREVRPPMLDWMRAGTASQRGICACRPRPGEHRGVRLPRRRASRGAHAAREREARFPRRSPAWRERADPESRRVMVARRARSSVPRRSREDREHELPPASRGVLPGGSAPGRRIHGLVREMVGSAKTVLDL